MVGSLERLSAGTVSFQVLSEVTTRFVLRGEKREETGVVETQVGRGRQEGRRFCPVRKHGNVNDKRYGFTRSPRNRRSKERTSQ